MMGSICTYAIPFLLSGFINQQEFENAVNDGGSRYSYENKDYSSEDETVGHQIPNIGQAAVNTLFIEVDWIEGYEPKTKEEIEKERFDISQGIAIALAVIIGVIKGIFTFGIGGVIAGIITYFVMAFLVMPWILDSLGYYAPLPYLENYFEDHGIDITIDTNSATQEIPDTFTSLGVNYNVDDGRLTTGGRTPGEVVTYLMHEFGHCIGIGKHDDDRDDGDVHPCSNWWCFMGNKGFFMEDHYCDDCWDDMFEPLGAWADPTTGTEHWRNDQRIFNKRSITGEDG